MTQMYERFNARDADGILGVMSEDVDWPNGWEGGRVSGKAAVKGYWERQWAAIDPKVTPVGFEELSDGRLRVTVQQVVFDKNGNLMDDRKVGHVYSFDNDQISRMDIED